MTKNAFCHYECYARKGAHKRRSKDRRPSLFDIHRELMRAPGGHAHIDNPKPPILLFGAHPDEVIEQAVALVAQAVDIRIDTPILLAGVMTWPVPREVFEKSHEERRKYLEWRDDAVAWPSRVWGDRLQCIVEHNDEPYPHLHFWALPSLRPDRQICISDVDFGRQAAKAVKDAGGDGRKQKAASAQAMSYFQDKYWRDVGIKHGLARRGPKRLRFTRKEWNDRKAEIQRVAEAWRALRGKHAELQSAANTHVAARIAEAGAAAEAAVEGARNTANERVAGLKIKGARLIGEWKTYATNLTGVIKSHEAVIAEQAERIQELETLLHEHGLRTGPTM